MSEQYDLTVGDTAEYEPQPVANETDISDDLWENADEDPIEYPDEQVLDDWIVYPSMAMGVLVTTFFPILLGQQICLPLLSAAVLIPMFLWALRQGRPRKAISLALFWVAVQSASVIVASLLFQDSAWRAVQGGLEYRTAWLQWIGGGPLVPMAPALNYARQGIDLVIYALAMALTGGVAGLLLLTLALDRLNFTVASLIAVAPQPALLTVAAWPLWMIVRLVGYIVVGAVLAEPIASLDLRPAYLATWLRARWRLLLLGLGVILLGVALQVLLSPLYKTIMQRAINGGI